MITNIRKNINKFSNFVLRIQIIQFYFPAFFDIFKDYEVFKIKIKTTLTMLTKKRERNIKIINICIPNS